MKKNNKNKVKNIICLIVLMVILLSGLFVFLFIKNTKHENQIDNKYAYTHVDKDYVSKHSKWTMLMYMCGSDLEDRSGLCSENINDILRACPSNNLQVVIETGGTTRWHGDLITNPNSDLPKNESLDRFIVENDHLTRIDEIATSSMVNKDTLCDFIKWGMQSAPADHYILVLWDHGSGATVGYGRDQLFHKEKPMAVTDVADAIKESGISLDILGFDACLMSGIETGVALSESAEYLIASEEIEPGDGWDYYSLITHLDNNNNASVLSIANILIEEYVKIGDTLSLIDLDKVPNLSKALFDYINSPCSFADLSKIRSNTKTFGKGMFDVVDINDFVEKSLKYDGKCYSSRTDDEKAKKVKENLEKTIIIKGSRYEDACGMSFYYPYKFPEYYEEKAEYLTENKIWNGKTRYYFDSFVESLIEGSMNHYDLSGKLVELNDEHAVVFNHDEYKSISDIKLTVFLKEDKANLLQGYDFYFDHTVEDNNDFLWYFDPEIQLYFEDSRVAFFATDYIEREDNTFELRGNIPARLNGKENILISVRFDNNHMIDASILGYTVMDDIDKGISSRDYLDFQEGDKIEFLFDYYDNDMKYLKTDIHEGNEPYIFGNDYMQNSPSVAFYSSDKENRIICYTITDIYLNEFITEGVLFDSKNQTDNDQKINTFVED